MKLRRIIAAVLCGVMLTGCQADERPQSSASESVSATVPETTTTTAATPPYTLRPRKLYNMAVAKMRQIRLSWKEASYKRQQAGMLCNTNLIKNRGTSRPPISISDTVVKPRTPFPRAGVFPR